MTDFYRISLAIPLLELRRTGRGSFLWNSAFSFHDWLEDRTLPSGTRVYACGQEGMLRNLYQEEEYQVFP